MPSTILNYNKEDIPQVQSMTSPKSGAPVANQFIIKVGNKEFFQSYSSIIAVKDYSQVPAKIILDSYYWDYSKTTSKYRNEFLGEYTAETRKKIASGKYSLAELN